MKTALVLPACTVSTVSRRAALSCYTLAAVVSVPKIPQRDFNIVHKELADIAWRLREAKEPQARVRLLRDMRQLLDEADRIAESQSSSAKQP